MLHLSLYFIVAVAVGGASGADDGLSDFSNDLFTDLGPLLALFGDSMARQYLNESTSFLDYFIFAMCPIGIITAVVSAIRLCGHSSLRAFVGRSQEGNGVVEAELCTSTSRDVCELFSRGGIARVLGRPTILELIQVEEQQPDHKAGLYLSRHFFTTDEAANPWTRVKDSYNNSLGSPASNPPNLSLNVGIVKQDDWKFLAVAILGFTLQAGALALAGVGVWVFEWNLTGDGNSASRNYAPIMFIVGTTILCGGLWACAALIGESTREIRYKRRPGAEKSSQLIWLQPHQVIGDQSFDPFAYLDKDMSIKVWTASKKETQNRQNKMYQVGTSVGVAGVLIGYVMQFIGLRGMKAWVSLTQLGITIIMSILRGLLRMQRLDSNGNDNELADMPDLVEGYELEWLAFKITQSKTSSTVHGSSNEWESPVDTNPSAIDMNNERNSQGYQSRSGAQITSEIHSCNESGISVPTGHAAIHPHAISGHRKDSTSSQRFTEHQEQIAPFDHPVSSGCLKHSFLQNEQKRLLSVRERLSHLTGHIPAMISLEDGTFAFWKDNFVKVRTKARHLSTALELVANSLFREDTAGDIKVPVLGFIGAVHCASCDHNYPVTVNFKATHGQYGLTWAVDSAKIEALLGIIMWSLLSDPLMMADRDKESPFKTSWSDIIQTRRIVSASFGADGVDSIARAQAEVDLWLGSNRLEISQAHIRQHDSTKFNLRDLWKADRSQQVDEWDPLSPTSKVGPDEDLGRFCGWTKASTPFETSAMRIEQARESTTTPSEHINSRPTTYAQCILTQGSLLETCTKELFSTLLLGTQKEIEIKHPIVKELKSEVRLESPTVDTLAKIFVDAGLGSYSEALPYIIPELRSQLYDDGFEGFFRNLLKSAQTYRRQSQWGRADTLMRWACIKSFHLHSLPKTQEKFFKRAFIAAGELYRLSLCQTGSAERMKFGNIGIDWMISKALGDFSQARRHVVSDEIHRLRTCYRHVTQRFKTDPKGNRTGNSLKYYIEKNCREDALHHLSLRRTKHSIYQAPDSDLLVLITKKDWLEILTALLEMQVDPNSRDKDQRTAISCAAELDHDLCALALIENGALLEEPDPAKEGKTPMVLAAGLRSHNTLRYLISSGRVDIDRPDANNISPLMEAINLGHEDTAHLLLSKGANINRKVRDETLLDRAAMDGEEAKMEFLINNGAAVNGLDDQSFRPLHWALSRRQEKATQLLVNRGANVDTPSGDGRKAIHIAIQEYSEPMVKFLLRNGASVNSASTDGRTPLSFAAERGGEEKAIMLLIEEGADINQADDLGQTPLSFAVKKFLPAVENGQEKVIRLLLEKGAGVNQADTRGQTPLSWAAKKGQEKLVRLLLEKGADINQAGTLGLTPLLWVVIHGQEKLVRLLLEKGADIDQADTQGQTPLSWAAEKGQEKLVRLLLEKGASVDVANCSGLTPLLFAISSKHKEVVKILLDKGASVDWQMVDGKTPLLMAETTAEIYFRFRDQGQALELQAGHGEGQSSVESLDQQSKDVMDILELLKMRDRERGQWKESLG